MKYLLFIFTFALLLTGCKKDKELTCGIEDPLEDLEWLRELKNEIEGSCDCWISIAQGEYNNQTVFFTQPHPACDPAGIILLDCNGDVLEVIDFLGDDPDEEEIKNYTTIYSCMEI